MSLLVVGSMAYDTIRTPDGAEHKDVLGGSCTYFSVAASYLTDVRIVGVVGEDFRQEDMDLLRAHEIDLDGLEVKAGGQTFRWAGTYSEDMNDRTTDDLRFGVLGEFDPVLPEAYRSTPCAFLACAQPELQLKVMDQMAQNTLFVSDTIEFYIENHRDALVEVLKRSDGVIMNDGEVKMLTGESNVVRAGERLLAMGPRFAIVKKGEHGCLLFGGETIYPYPAFPLRTLADPTGAGDTFAGGVMAYLACTAKSDLETLRQGVVYGTILASLTCEGISLNRLAALTPGQIRERADQFRGMLAVPLPEQEVVEDAG